MIIYDLSCDQEHRFEGWFQSPEEFERQVAEKLVCCPQCDSHVVRRIPSAVAIGGKSTSAETPVVESAEQPVSQAMMPNGAYMKAVFRQFVKAVMAGSEDVGEAFAEEARKIHYEEAPPRPIRGNVTSEELQALADEGIDVLPLPETDGEDLH